jgi:hypothetical protein
VAFTRKDFYGLWDYLPDAPTEPRAGGGKGEPHGPGGWTLTDVSVAETEERRRRARAKEPDR